VRLSGTVLPTRHWLNVLECHNEVDDMHSDYKRADILLDDIKKASEEVLNHLGPGLLESVYEECLAHELKLLGYSVEKEKQIIVNYKGHQFEHSLRADLIVDDCVILELKSIEGSIRTEHRMQLLSYLKLANYPLGMVINFGATSAIRYRRVILSGANLPESDF
jgi:GxxExxY protein